MLKGGSKILIGSFLDKNKCINIIKLLEEQKRFSSKYFLISGKDLITNKYYVYAGNRNALEAFKNIYSENDKRGD